MKFFLALMLVSGFAYASDDAKLSSTCKLSYPKTALIEEQQGTVTMKVTVSEAGSVLGASLDKSSGFKALDKAALEQIKGCKFAPAVKDGSPIKDVTTITYVWKLD